MKFSINKSWLIMSIATLLAMTSQANAGLIKRTDNLIYDDVNDITWFADINGKSNWHVANTWVGQLTVDNISGWSLPDLATGLLLEVQDESLFSYISGTPSNTPKFWSSETFTNTASDFKAYWFQIDNTTNNVKASDENKYAFAFIKGDVATVSEPATIVMFSLAFAGLAYRRKQLKQK